MNLLLNRIHRAAALGLLLVSTLLVSCGGGEKVGAFVPSRLLVFGDESSVIADPGNTGNGRKYTVNAVQADLVTLDCAASPIWVQNLATAFGQVLPPCNPNSVADLRSRIYAEPGAKVADVVDQIDQHLAIDTFSDTDLISILAGANDVIEQYSQYPAVSQVQLRANLRAAGQTLAEQVNRIALAGGKVLISTVPDLGFSPFALAENINTGESNRAAVISDLAAGFNEGLRVGLLRDSGRNIALMLTDELVQTMAKFPANYAMTNTITAVCDPALAPTVELCTTQTLISGGSATAYLWADGLHLSPGGYNYVGQLAVTRVNANPF